jgi:hypothetical protein
MGRAAVSALTAAGLLAVGPYVVAEIMTGFRNTRGMFGHAPQVSPIDAALGFESFVQVLRLAADPTERLIEWGAPGWGVLALGALVVTFAAMAWQPQSRPLSRETANGEARPILWLVMASLLCVAAQAAFFLVLNRGLEGRHYTAMLVPFYVLPLAALIVWATDRLPTRLRAVSQTALGLGCLLLLLWRGPTWADRYWERTDLTYDRITSAIEALCEPGAAARTAEGAGYATLAPGHDPVLKYLMTRRFVQCRHDDSADRIIVAARNGDFAPTRQEGDGLFELARVVPPGIAEYRRAGP